MAAWWDTTSFPFTLGEVALGLGVFVLSTLVTTAIVTAFFVSIPPDHFDRLPVLRRRRESGGGPDSAAAEQLPSPARFALAVGKNILGAVLVIMGIVLALPGVPGQGMLTVLVGILLLDIPGKRKLERRLVSRPSLLRNINKVRVRFKRPPLHLDPKADGDD